jgi:antitoxin ParD1/3/4
MQLSLTPEMQRFIDDRLKSGMYGSPEEVVAAALALLEQQEAMGDFEPGEMQRLIDEGDRSGDALDAEQVFAEIRELRNRHSHNKAG